MNSIYNNGIKCANARDIFADYNVLHTFEILRTITSAKAMIIKYIYSCKICSQMMHLLLILR